jgi:beta-glucosidase/6-phospho-beta-glucosidase/beta-galactosidase
LVYVDFATQERIVKSSGRWYSNFLKDKQQPAAEKILKISKPGIT